MTFKNKITLFVKTVTKKGDIVVFFWGLILYKNELITRVTFEEYSSEMLTCQIHIFFVKFSNI